MGNNITFVPYALRLRTILDGKPLRLDALPGGLSILKVMGEYCVMRTQNKSVNDKSRRALKFYSQYTDESTFIDGKVQGGSFGYESEIEDLHTGATFQKGVEGCEYLPFYFYLWTKPGQDEAIFILQKFGTLGVKSILELDLQQYIIDHFPDLRLSINPVVTERYLAKIIGGGIKAITCIRFDVPKDVADDLGFEDHDESEGKLKIRVEAGGRGFLSVPAWMRDIGKKFPEGKKKYAGKGWEERGKMIEVNGIEYNDITLDIDVGNKMKTMHLSDIKKVRMNIDITKDVVIGKDGHPTLESMRSLANDIVPEIALSIGWQP